MKGRPKPPLAPLAGPDQAREGGQIASRATRKPQSFRILEVSGLETYTRSSDGAVMIEIAPHIYLNAESLLLASGRRITGE